MFPVVPWASHPSPNPLAKVAAATSQGRCLLLSRLCLATAALLGTLLSGARPALARPIISEMFSYDSLAKQADTILIVSVQTPSERTGEQSTFQGAPVDCVRTLFKVQAVLKGSFKAETYELNHLAYPQGETQGLVNEWGFVWFANKHDQGLVFLKTGADGKPEPVTGQEDLEPSFVRLASNMGAPEKRNSPPAPAPEPAAPATNTVAAIGPAPSPQPPVPLEPLPAVGLPAPTALTSTNAVAAPDAPAAPLPGRHTVSVPLTSPPAEPVPPASCAVPATVSVSAPPLVLEPEPVPALSVPPVTVPLATNAVPVPASTPAPRPEPKSEPVPVAGLEPELAAPSTNPVPAASIQPVPAGPAD